MDKGTLVKRHAAVEPSHVVPAANTVMIQPWENLAVLQTDMAALKVNTVLLLQAIAATIRRLPQVAQAV